MRRAPLNGHLQIFLKQATVEGYDPGGLSKASTKPTHKRIDELDDAMREAMLPQQIGALNNTVPTRISMKLQEGAALLINERDRAPQQFEVDNGEDWIHYLAGGDRATDEAVSSLLGRMWQHVSTRSLEYWRTTALTFHLAEPDQFEPRRQVDEADQVEPPA